MFLTSLENNVIFGYSMVVGDCSPHVLSLENL